MDSTEEAAVCICIDTTQSSLICDYSLTRTGSTSGELFGSGNMSYLSQTLYEPQHNWITLSLRGNQSATWYTDFSTIDFSKYHRSPPERGPSLFSNEGKLYPGVPPLLLLGRTLEFHCWFNRNETGWIWGYFINLPSLSLKRKLRQIEFKTDFLFFYFPLSLPHSG